MKFSSEDDVRFHHVPAILKAKGYEPDHFSYNVSITVKQGRKTTTIFADVVVYADAAKAIPLLVVETKGPDEVITQDDVEQGISYARLLPTIAPVVLLTNGSPAGTTVYDTFTKKLLKGIPTYKDSVKTKAKVTVDKSEQLALAAEAKTTVFKVDDVDEFKRILRGCHNDIRNNHGYDPTKSFDELSKIFQCKFYEEMSGKNRFNTKTFNAMLDAGNVNVIHQIFDETKKHPRFAGLFDSDSKIELDDRTIRQIVGQLEGYDLTLTDFDVKGEAFEHFLGETFTSGLGQYFTPRTVVDFVVRALEPKMGQKVVDPFCGTGGFLIFWHDSVDGIIRSAPITDDQLVAHKRQLDRETLHGTDWDHRTSLACRMNMAVHGEGESAQNIFQHSGYVDVVNDAGEILIGEGMFDVCVTNPPFGSTESDPEILGSHELGSGRKSIERAALAMERALRLVKPGGWVGIIVMDGVLSNASMKFVRDYVRKNAFVRMAVSLAPETFEAYGGRSDTTVLLLEKKATPDEGSQEAVFMAVCDNAGFAPNGAPIPGNQLPGILTAYQAWRRDEEFSYGKTWVVDELGDRLDARNYYRPTSAANSTALPDDVQALTARVEATVPRLQGLYAEVSSALAHMDSDLVAVGDLLDRVEDKVPVDPGTVYSLLGVRWWGEGAFVRETKKGSAIKSAGKIQRAAEGLLIYNRLFAWKGSFAVIGADCAQGFASNEFPMYDAKTGVENPEMVKRYIVHAMNSPQYLSVVDAMSTGSTKTSRNRLQPPAFESFKIAVPHSAADMELLVKMLDEADSVRQELERIVGSLKGVRQGLAGLIPSA